MKTLPVSTGGNAGVPFPILHVFNPPPPPNLPGSGCSATRSHDGRRYSVLHQWRKTIRYWRRVWPPPLNVLLPHLLAPPPPAEVALCPMTVRAQHNPLCAAGLVEHLPRPALLLIAG